VSVLVLNDSPADVLRWLLIALGVGSDPDAMVDWPVFVSVEPSEPDNCITCYDTAWRSDGRGMPTGETYNHYGAQVRVRAVDHRTGWSKAQQIRDKLDRAVKENALTVNGTEYIVEAVSKTDVLSIGQDTPDTKRQLFTMNPFISLQSP
jgi:hypothetical protein